MNQGCINEGKDQRLFGKLTCWLQRLGSFKSNVHPLVLQLEFPLGFRLYIPYGKYNLFMLRVALWRYDVNATPPTYIFFSAAAKVVKPNTSIS